MPKKISAKILGEMPGRQMQEIVKAMVALHERVEPTKPVRGVGEGIVIDIEPTGAESDVEVKVDPEFTMYKG